MYLIIGLDKAVGCKQDACEKHLDVPNMHLDVSDIHLKVALNSHAQKLYKPRWVEKLWTSQPFKD